MDSLPNNGQTLKRRARGAAVLAIFCAICVCAALYLLGLFTLDAVPNLKPVMHIALAVSAAVLIAVVTIVRIRLRGYIKRINSVSVADFGYEMKSEKDSARSAADGGDVNAAAKKLYGEILRARIFVITVSALYIIAGFASASSPGGVFISLLFGVIPYAVFYRTLVLSMPIYDWSDFARESDYPCLYSIARRAADACGVRGKIHLNINGLSADAGIAKIGRGRSAQYSLLISAPLLDMVDEEETYAILLHEFSHVNAEATVYPTNNRVGDWLLFEEPCESAKYDVIGGFLMKYFAIRTSFESFKFKISSSEFVERLADIHAVKYCNPEDYAAALIKICTWEHFERLEDDYIDADYRFYAGETCPKEYCGYYISCFRNAFDEKRAEWFEIFKREKQPRNASHPILRDRLASIGVNPEQVTYSLPPQDGDSDFRRECRRAILYVNAQIEKSCTDNYGENRKICYLDPKDTVERFESSDRVCTAEEYREIIGAYMSLGRQSDAIKFCRSVAENEDIPFATKYYPVFRLGVYLLNHDDREGLEMVYKAADCNSNVQYDAIDAIGAYCCRNGLEGDYEEYRRRADEWLQNNRDVVSKRVELSASDNLSVETFSVEKLNTLLSFMINAGNGKLTSIYLVHKTIGENDYVSQFFLEYAEDTDEEEQYEIYDKIFNYLDTVPDGWHYALLDLTPEYEKILKKTGDTCVYRIKN